MSIIIKLISKITLYIWYDEVVNIQKHKQNIWKEHIDAIYHFWGASRSSGPAEWLALLLTKVGDVKTNPGPTTLHKRVWICDICPKQIHVRKQISIRYKRIEHCVHLRCAGIRQAQYTDTWTCHLHRESRLTPHTDITPPHPSRPWSKPPTHSQHHCNQNTDPAEKAR